ncbi:ABC transporter permease [Dongia soli]|uniref:ABC transporter permease n=1 Tax=Dongia soli TaxID=600628 RepID=A0ABU5EEQ4_9PROT|nr:ABC transporter permease [Dongia soli]MDY0884864.1 ABC transporter permease [Dongia soli]
MQYQSPLTPRAKRWLEIRKPISRRTTIILGVSLWAAFFIIWEAAVKAGFVTELLMPSPTRVLSTLAGLLSTPDFLMDIGASMLRIAISFLMACIVAVPLGIAMGTFRVLEAFFNPFMAAWRYLPAPSFIPVLLMWFGTGEGPKLALLFIGVVFFLITLVMDYTKQVRQEFVETSMTLGGNRKQILWTVIVPAVLPNVVVAMRQMMAVSWTYLVIAEIVASTNGIGAMMMRARRFLHTDEIMAGIVVIGVLGLLCDMAFRWLHRLMFPYVEESAR